MTFIGLPRDELQKLSSTKFGNVTFKFGLASITLLIAKTAPSFLAQLRRDLRTLPTNEII